MQQVALKASYRKGTGYGPAKRLRSAGLVPAIVYGIHAKPLTVQVQSRELGKVLHSSTGENVLVELELADGATAEKRLALIRDVQHDAMTGQVMHVDFNELKADQKFNAVVPVVAVGECVGVKNGGVLEISMHRVHVTCLPKDLPDKLELDVTKLEIGGKIHVGEIPAVPGVTLLDRKDLPVIAIVAPAAEEAAATSAAGAEAAAGAEPEVLKQKAGEEGAEAPAAGGKKAEGKPAAGKADAKAEAKPEAKKK